jgi:hypothetical protein
LPRGLLSGLHPDAAKRLRRRAAVESAWELRRHPTRIRLPLLAAWVLPREAEIVDGLVELLIAITHRITVRAERKVVAELIEEARTVRGKTGILFKVASAVTEAPDGVVREVIFPVVDERTFHSLVKEALAAGTTPARRVHTAVRASYGSYYRRMMPKLLAALDFRSNNGAHRPLIEALERVRAAEGEGRQHFSCDEVPIEGSCGEVARHHYRGGARRRHANQPHQLRDRISRRCARSCAARGLGQGAHRSPQPDDDSARRLRRAQSRLFERLVDGRAGLHRQRQGRDDDTTPARAEPHHAAARRCDSAMAPASDLDHTARAAAWPPSLEAVRAELAAAG